MSVFYPGIRKIGYIPAENLPLYMQEQASVGLAVTMYVSPTPINLVGEQKCEVVFSDEGNGNNETVKLIFRSLEQLPSESLAFVFEDMKRDSYLIGQYEPPRPSIKCTKETGTLGGDPVCYLYEVNQTGRCCLKKCSTFF